MALESHLRSLLSGFRRLLRHWRRLRELDRELEAAADDARQLRELLEGARRRLEDHTSEAAFRALLEEDVRSVRGIGPTLAERIATHTLMGGPTAFRRSVDRVKGVGPKKKERLLAWEEDTRPRYRELRPTMLEAGGVDPELEATIRRLADELEEARAAEAEVRERRGRLARGGPVSGAVNEPTPAPVVLDTNVFVGAGFNPDSASAALLDAVRHGRLRMPWSDATRAEVERILRKIPPLSWSDAAPLFRDRERLTDAPDESGLAWIPDPDDRPFAALARSSGAALVSSDDDLLGGRERAGFPVWTPGEARERLLNSKRSTEP